MLWGQELFGRTFAPDLIAVAKDLYREADRQTRFVVAGASPDSRLYDDAVVIVAESGVPAYFSCPQSIMMRQDAFGDEARKRAVVQDRLDHAASASELQAIMAANKISHYVVTGPDYARFDANRHLAKWFQDGNAIYSERDLANKLKD